MLSSNNIHWKLFFPKDQSKYYCVNSIDCFYRNIKLETPYAIKRLPDELHYTYLDTSGRPVIIARKDNLVESHIQPFTVWNVLSEVIIIMFLATLRIRSCEYLAWTVYCNCRILHFVHCRHCLCSIRLYNCSGMLEFTSYLILLADPNVTFICSNMIRVPISSASGHLIV
jgi:hypothetical protein